MDYKSKFGGERRLAVGILSDGARFKYTDRVGYYAGDIMLSLDDARQLAYELLGDGVPAFKAGDEVQTPQGAGVVVAYVSGADGDKVWSWDCGEARYVVRYAHDVYAVYAAGVVTTLSQWSNWAPYTGTTTEPLTNSDTAEYRIEAGVVEVRHLNG